MPAVPRPVARHTSGTGTYAWTMGHPTASRRAAGCLDTLVRKVVPRASATRRAARSASRQHALYFFPLPQGQGALRPIFAMASSWGPRGSLHRDLTPRSTVEGSRLARGWPRPGRRRLRRPVVRRLLGDDHVVHVALAEPLGG